MSLAGTRYVASVALIAIVMHVSADAAVAQWEIVLRGAQTSLHGVYFVDDSVGIAVGTGVILRTIDAGLNWSAVDSTTFPGIQFEHVSCEPTEQGTVCLAVGSSLTIARSVDRGETWRLVHQEFSATFESSCLLEGGTLVSVGVGGWLARSTNTGLNWESQLIYPQADLYAATATPDGALWAGGFQAQPPGNCCGVVMKSDDTGDHWVVAHALPDASNGQVEDIQFLTDQTVVALAIPRISRLKASLWRSNDGGVTWARFGVFERVFAMDFRGDMTGVMVGELGVIYWTEDGGETWTTQENPVIGNFYDVKIIGEHTAIAVGDGTIIRNENGTITAAETEEVPRGRLAHWAYPNPSSGTITIGYAGAAARSSRDVVRVLDLLGRLVVERRSQPGSGVSQFAEFSTANLVPGLYLYIIESDGAVASGNFVVGR